MWYELHKSNETFCCILLYSAIQKETWRSRAGWFAKLAWSDVTWNPLLRPAQYCAPFSRRHSVLHSFQHDPCDTTVCIIMAKQKLSKVLWCGNILSACQPMKLLHSLLLNDILLYKVHSFLLLRQSEQEYKLYWSATRHVKMITLNRLWISIASHLLSQCHEIYTWSTEGEPFRAYGTPWLNISNS